MIDIKELVSKTEPTASSRLINDSDLENGLENFTKDRDLIKDFLPEMRELMGSIK